MARKITILFERWLQMFELRYGTRSQDYPFAYIELSINDNGKGEGSLIGLAKVSFDKSLTSEILSGAMDGLLRGPGVLSSMNRCLVQL